MLIKMFEKMVENEINAPFEQRMLLSKKMYDVLLEFYEIEKYDVCISLLLLIKRLKCPIKNLNVVRAKLQAFGNLGAEGKFYREELGFSSDNEDIKMLLEQHHSSFDHKQFENTSSDFADIYMQIRDYTMVEIERLFPLYISAQKICASNVTGNFVECGVAGGGTSAMLAHVVKQNIKSSPKRKLFCFDSFEGMPEPSEYDMSFNGVHASQTIWCAGTCAAPESSVREICKKLNSDDVIHIVKGYFENTLSTHRASIGGIALLHMDGDWYSSTKTIIENLYDQLVSGAYVQIDDYLSWQGCKKAVDEFFIDRNIEVHLESVDGAAVSFYKP